MSVALRISFLIGVLIYLSFILIMLSKKRLTLKYSLIWIITAILFLIIDLFPKILTFISKLLCIQTPANAIFALMIFFILILLISLTSIVSKQNQEIRRLIQEVAILEKEIQSKSE